MTSTPVQTVLTLEPNDPHLLAQLCGQFDEHLQLIEQRLGVRIGVRGNALALEGSQSAVDTATGVIEGLYRECENGAELNPETIHIRLQETGLEQPREGEPNVAALSLIRTKNATIKPRGKNQQLYVKAIKANDINFGVGPAGTGKTYLAVACAVEALLNHQVERILLVRPAVEAGEKLGFLPGDLAQKIDPYLRPLYDALYEMMGFEVVSKLIERNVIEIAPLAYMRGRTLNNSYILLDEAQNTTREQMKMFLTRIGFGSTAIVTGDATQIDLPRGTPSGLTHVLNVLKEIDGISMTFFQSKDVVRHPLVQRIVEAYESYNGDAASFDKTKS
ncbi:phosphate starvation-inducible PhoH-like protein [Litorivivens lipolytica]|uniref:PhoH-like protein n=1 Tax=Litorivivens lipolytica TaxID=1524264 RepID=A0A7W4W3U6_9GAMM|nr:PhoH family protein [Litorivivens lipolytica]MBB3046945.1 phosphate starvation-inducible PhoH-like protein [Litorivivens lipolytica]